MNSFSRPVYFNCSGCGACAAICPQGCIEMKVNEEGFLQTVVSHDDCMRCDLCNRVCPVLIKPIKDEILDNPKIVAANNLDEDIRALSSSGGIFSVLAREVINQGGKVYGAAFDHDFSVIHVGISNLMDLHKLRGSKYIQSRMGTTYQEIRAELRNGMKILFTGTPCQVAGLYSFLDRTYENLFTCDLVCHGVPSPKVFLNYLTYLRKKYRSEIQSISFRDKRTGWGAYSMAVVFKNGKVYTRTHRQDIFMRGFLRNLYLQPACYDCAFTGFPRWGDITLADYWGVKDIHPEFNDNKGTSLLFINTNRGLDLFNQVSNQVKFTYSTMEDAVKHNYSILNSVKAPANRDTFFMDLDKFPFKIIILKYGLLPLPVNILKILLWTRSKIKFLKNIIGTLF